VAEGQLQQATYLYNSVTGIRDLGSAVGALSGVGIQNPLPVDPYAVQNLISGNGGASGVLASLGQVYTGNLSANRLYIPNASDYQSQRMAQNASGIAGIQTLLQQSYQSAAQRIQQLMGLQTTASATASDPKAVLDAQMHTQFSMAATMAQQLQVSNIGTATLLQERAADERAAEYHRCQIDTLIAYLRQNEGGVAPSSAPNCQQDSVPVAQGDAAALGQNMTLTPSGGPSSAPLDTMLATPWGESAANNAAALGVTPEALAGTCVIESGCRNIAGPGTASGPFQMISSTYSADLNQALSENPQLQPGDRSDPSTQSKAAAQDLKNAALGLQGAGVSNPTFLDTRGYYNFGAAYGTSLALADPSTPMSSILTSYTPSQLAANGISPNTTVGQWRQSIINKVGSKTASAPVLTSA
jgi:hypothetical protein